MNAESDEQIVRLYLERSETAISQTQQKYGKLCLDIANRILRNAEDSEECLNDALLSVWNSIPPAKPDDFRAFVCRITRNFAVSRLRYNTRQKRSAGLEVSLSELEEILPDSRVNVSDDIEIGSAVEKFLKKQRPVHRKIFVLKYCYFYTQKEIAQIYSFSEAKVNSILSRMRKKLRDHLIKEGIEI